MKKDDWQKMTSTEQGLMIKYKVEKLVGENDPDAKYFVLRYDNLGWHAKACRKALLCYADAIQFANPTLANDLRKEVKFYESESEQTTT